MTASESFPSYTYRWESPDGGVYTNVIETSPLSIIVTIGKAGTSVAGWAYALGEMVNVVLKYESLDTVIDILSGITTHQSVSNIARNLEVRSTAEAIAFSLIEYKRMKKKDAIAQR